MIELEALCFGNMLLARAVKHYGLSEKGAMFTGGGYHYRNYSVHFR